MRITADGQPRRERNPGSLFNLQTRPANREASEREAPQRQGLVLQHADPPSAQEKWLRLMGAARQVAYQAGEQPMVPAEAANQRYRLQRTYFDQERQADPPQPASTDYRLAAYHQAEKPDTETSLVDFVI